MIVTPIHDIVIVDTSGEISNYACEVISHAPLKCNMFTIIKHITNELIRKIYSDDKALSADNLAECIKRKLGLRNNIEVIGLIKR